MVQDELPPCEDENITVNVKLNGIRIRASGKSAFLVLIMGAVITYCSMTML